MSTLMADSTATPVRRALLRSGVLGAGLTGITLTPDGKILEHKTK